MDLDGSDESDSVHSFDAGQACMHHMEYCEPDIEGNDPRSNRLEFLDQQARETQRWSEDDDSVISFLSVTCSCSDELSDFSSCDGMSCGDGNRSHIGSLEMLEIESQPRGSAKNLVSEGKSRSKQSIAWDGPATKVSAAGCPSVAAVWTSTTRVGCNELNTLTSKREPAGLQSPFMSLPEEILRFVMSFLDISSLLDARLACKALSNQGAQDSAGWSDHCERLWNSKVLVNRRSIKLKKATKAMLAYSTSCQDGQCRNEIELSELCFDPASKQGTVWHFRFKESAGSAWTNIDPWHAGLDARKMVFFRDGTVRQLVYESSSGGSSFRIEHPFFDGAVPNVPRSATPIEMKWRMLLDPMDMPYRPHGAYIRLNVGGRDVPTYIVQRSPTGNWGFIFENCWGIFASFPLPRRQNEQMRDVLNRPTRMRLRRDSSGVARWMDVNGIESESDDEEEEVDRSQVERNVDLQLLEDQALNTTSRHQWREALLYNYGAVSLPEGEAARDEFDRIFDSFRGQPRQYRDVER